MMKDKLEKAFGNCKYPHECTCTVKSSFEITSASRFYIFDEAGRECPVKIVSEGDDWQLQVSNPAATEICLVKTDDCLLDDSTKKCDCILFTATKCFLAEIKTVSRSVKNKRRKDAREQLGTTIRLLRGKNIEPTDYNTTAVICFKNNRPIIVNAASNSAKAGFLAEFGIMLEEKNTIEF
jgi:hypothetical protein